MRIVVQNFKTGELSVDNSPVPKCSPEGVLVRTNVSLISAGTDRAVIGLAKKNLLGKAMDRPDLARKVMNKVKTDGFWPTYKVVKNLIADPIPLGYSLVGTVVEVGRNIIEVKPGDRVACAGLGFANHAEYVAVPKNLFVKVPEDVEDEQAAYVTLGAIAMHGIRQAEQQFGSVLLVIGLGLLGQICLLLCRTAGYRVIGLDLDARKLKVAKANGAYVAFLPDDPNLPAAIAQLTGGLGVDAVLLTLESRNSGKVFEKAASLCRDRGRVVVIGDVKMDIVRRTFFEKELEIVQSRSYGPGRYDPEYEEKGHDYPAGYVRWTERRNMQAFINMIRDRLIDLRPLTTHRFAIEHAKEAYALVTGKSKELTIGILLEYDTSSEITPDTKVAITRNQKKTGKVGLGVIGSGQFAKGVLLPALIQTHGFDMIGVCSSRGLSSNTVRDRYGAEFSTTDANALLDNTDVEAVVITTRHDSHAYYVIEALKRDKHVFVEKPLCLTREELKDIAKVAYKSAGTLMVGYNRRFSKPVQLICEHFKGRVEPLTMSYRVNAGRILRKSEMGWVHDPAVGGGRIIGEVCHFIDTLQAISGASPVSIDAYGVVPAANSIAENDIVTITIHFNDGSLATIHYWANGDPGYPKERLEVFGQEKIAVLNNYRSVELVSGGRTRKKSWFSIQKGYVEEVKAFLEACCSGKPMITLESLFETSMATITAAEDLKSFI